MSDNKPTSVSVNYYYSKNGAKTRSQATLSVSQNLNQGTTESAVLNYLRNRHSGYEIELLSLEWK